jgi:hypothetical protein
MIVFAITTTFTASASTASRVKFELELELIQTQIGSKRLYNVMRFGLASTAA